MTLMIRRTKLAGLLAVCWVLLAPAAFAGEILEEIVAWVNGDIITKSDYDDEEEVVVAQAYRELTGEELDLYLEEVRTSLLLSMIDRKILVDQAQRIYDLDTMGGVFLEQFKEQQEIKTDEELERLLQQEGMTIEDVTQRLVEMRAPDEVIRFEVKSRVSVSEREIEAFYEENKEKFLQPAEVTLREIVLLAPEGTNKAEARTKAEAARQRVVDGADFAEVAQEVSESGSRESGGLLGTFKRKDLAEHLAVVAFELPVGEVSDLIETSYGFHILKVESRAAAEITPLEDVHDRIGDVLEQMKFGAELDAYLVKVRGESEWCVKQKYKEQLGIDDAPACEDT